jgi:hypothetical protein
LQGVGTIGGASVALQLDGGRTLENDGWLGWSDGAIQLGSGDGSTVTHAGTFTNAGVLSITAADQLSASDGSKLINSGVIAVDSGVGPITIAAALENDGVLALNSGNLSIQQMTSGTGIFRLDGTATLDFVAGAGKGSTLMFINSGDTVEVDTAGLFGAALWQFGAGDWLDARSVSFAAATASFDTGRLTVNDGVHSTAFDLNGSYSPSGFHLSSDGHGGTAVNYA